MFADTLVAAHSPVPRDTILQSSNAAACMCLTTLTASQGSLAQDNRQPTSVVDQDNRRTETDCYPFEDRQNPSANR